MSVTALVLAAAEPWTYWMAPPLLVVGALGVVAVLVGYYRKVLVPRYERALYEAELARQEREVEARPATPVRRRRPLDGTGLARAA